MVGHVADRFAGHVDAVKSARLDRVDGHPSRHFDRERAQQSVINGVGGPSTVANADSPVDVTSYP